MNMKDGLTWYGMQGERLTMRQYLARYGKRDGKRDPCRVAYTVGTFFEISTVLLGIDHRFGAGRPIIFETMVFSRWLMYSRGCTFGSVSRPGYWSRDSVAERRYCTAEEARAGHAEIVRECTGLSGHKRFIVWWGKWLKDRATH